MAPPSPLPPRRYKTRGAATIASPSTAAAASTRSPNSRCTAATSSPKTKGPPSIRSPSSTAAAATRLPNSKGAAATSSPKMNGPAAIGSSSPDDPPKRTSGTRRSGANVPNRSGVGASTPVARHQRAIISSEEEHFKTRFSVRRIRKLILELSHVWNRWIREVGLEALLNPSDISVPVKLVKWIMQHIDPIHGHFKFKNKIISFDRGIVCKILGLPRGNVPLKFSGKSKLVKDLRSVYKEGERAKIMKCIDVVKNSTDKESFLRAFILLAIATVFGLFLALHMVLFNLHNPLLIQSH